MLRAGKTQIVKKNKMNVLILGASSDIGLEVTKIFLDKGFEVTAHCYKNKKIFKKFNNYKKINYINFNLKNSQLFEKYLNKNINKIKTFDIFISLFRISE
jgi:NADP-dependent 3-hydroxy acid dehydrogenase YdfG